MNKCTKCEQLVKSRCQIVFPTKGSSNQILVVGEAPGKDEDFIGEGFVGVSGRNLNNLFAAINFSKDQYSKTNICRCRPPDNRKPTTKEIESCLPFLLEFIKEVNPKIILTVGYTAASIFCGKIPLYNIIKLQQENYFSSNSFSDFIHPLIKDAIFYATYFISIPHTSPLAFNRFCVNGKRWKDVAIEQMQLINDLLK